MPAEPEHSAAAAVDGAVKLNALRPAALLWTLPALVVVFLVMAADRRFELGLPVASVALLVACAGLLDALGTFDDPAPPRVIAGQKLLGPLLLAVASCGALVGALRAAVSGVLPWPIVSAAVLVTSTSIAVLLSGYALVRALGVFDEDGPRSRRLLERHGFWLLLLAILLYVPLLGSYSLIDPWETHYGEVSREMLARDDWISLWWAQDGWFWSKPALTFWLQGLAFLLFGVRYQPDAMLGSVAQGRLPQPEWAVRWPTMVLALLATYLAYKAVAHVAGRRAGFLGGLVLITSPHWFFLAHQSMTDMPYVACLTAALALVLLGSSCDPERKARVHAVSLFGRHCTLSLVHGVLGLVALSAVPQLVYLLSRNVPLILGAPATGLRLQRDVFLAGSPGNCGLPGNDDCSMMEAATVIQPAMSAVLWAAALGWLLVAKRGERRVQRLYFLAAWYFMALSLLAKGAPGLVLPLAVVAVALCAARRFRDFARLELVSCALLVACVALPWYVQAFLRHGSEFTDRLLFHDMYKRAFVHVHDTNAGDDVSFSYYLWQLGYGLFPWTPVCGIGVLWWLRSGDEAERPEAELYAFLGLWFLLAFGMFTLSLTKFHHYILPAVPPLALLAGCVLDRLLNASTSHALPRRVARWAALGASAVLLVVGAARASVVSVLGVLPGPWFAALTLALGVAAFAVALWLAERPSAPEGGGDARFQSAALSLLSLLGAALVLLIGRDFVTDANVVGQGRLLNLFSYNYTRVWPETLDFSAALRGFSVVFAATLALAALPRVRDTAVRLGACIATLWCLFGLDVYLVKLAPHWGQRETIATYYALRSGPKEPLIAYQMNWKGENFYTGNHLPAFVTSGPRFKQWLEQQRAQGTRVIFATTEHSRTAGLRRELGKVKSFRVITNPALNNKFTLTRIEL